MKLYWYEAVLQIVFLVIYFHYYYMKLITSAELFTTTILQYFIIFKPANYAIRKKTNLQNTGLISADRSTKATLLLTIPSSLFKSSAKDLSYPIFKITIQRLVNKTLPSHHWTSWYDLGARGSIFIQLNIGKVKNIVTF